MVILFGLMRWSDCHCFLFALAAALCFAVAGCSRHQPVDNPQPGVYYWRTTLRLDNTERDFLAQHHIGKMYVRYFDVVMRDGRPMPNATLQFLQPVPTGVEIIPTVFVMEECMRSQMVDEMARLLVERVLQMNETNDVPDVQELQIDCDWTEQSQTAYFAFLNKVGELLHERKMQLSATIRLHQLRMAPPPVDYGVLMVYNTGSVRRMDQRSPILDKQDVATYLGDLEDYDLKLCAAYPNFDWQVLYGSDGRYKAILYDEDLNDSSVYRQVAPDRWVVISSRDIPTLNEDASQATWVVVGDSVRLFRPSAELVLNTARALEKERPGINDQVIVYSLNSKNIKQYKSSYYESLYHHR